jgi:hypothetical protein
VKRVSTLERNFDMSASEKPLHIDIPVKLAEVRVAFSIPTLAFEGDLPASIFGSGAKFRPETSLGESVRIQTP